MQKLKGLDLTYVMRSQLQLTKRHKLLMTVCEGVRQQALSPGWYKV